MVSLSRTLAFPLDRMVQWANNIDKKHHKERMKMDEPTIYRANIGDPYVDTFGDYVCCVSLVNHETEEFYDEIEFAASQMWDYPVLFDTAVAVVAEEGFSFVREDDRLGDTFYVVPSAE